MTATFPETPVKAQLLAAYDALAQRLVSIQNPPEGITEAARPAWKLAVLAEWEAHHADDLVDLLREAAREIEKLETLLAIARDWTIITV